jgi:hypothetical protein
MSIEESAYPATPRQIAQYNALEDIAEIHGKWMQDTGSEGAHYVAESPFGAEGLLCQNCYFYEGPQGCEIVEGQIAPGGICKLWIIPGDLIQMASRAQRQRVLFLKARPPVA